jgi:hypothetical protein
MKARPNLTKGRFGHATHSPGSFLFAALLLAWSHALAAPGGADKVPKDTGTLPVIDQQPIGRTVTEGGSVALSVLAHATVPVSCQWWRGEQPVTNSTRLTGATNFVLSIDPAVTNSTDTGAYSAVLTSSGGSVTSVVVSLVVSQLLFQAAPMGGTGVLMTIFGQPGDVYRVEVSVNFGPYLTNGYTTNLTGQALFLDRDTTGGFRRLRARLDQMLPVLYPGDGTGAPAGLRAYGKLNQVWRLRGTTDLQQWTDLATVTNLTGWVKFTDPSQPPIQHRFYRIAPP